MSGPAAGTSASLTVKLTYGRLSWGIQRGTSVVPRSTKPDRIKSNFDLDGWELNEDEMAKLNAVKDRFKACGDGFLPIRVFLDDDE